MRSLFKMSRSRNYCFTINNPNTDDVSLLSNLECKYIVYGNEVGASGTPHFQGTVCFALQKTRSAVSKLLPRAHLEPTIALADSITYCKKEGDYVERGVPPCTQKEKGVLGKRVYEEALECAKKGDLDSIDPGLLTRYYKTYKQISADYQTKPESMDSIEDCFHWYYGASGTGKSRKARGDYPDAYLKQPNKWWQSYHGEETVIIDEWSPNHSMLAYFLKQWADHHPFPAETKGGQMVIRPKRIIITSNYTIDECFPNDGDSEPIKRRFKVTRFSNPFGALGKDYGE